MSLALLRRLAELARPLDPRLDPLQAAVRRAVGASRPVANALDGTWLGAPLHAGVTDLPVGALTAAVALDLAGRDAEADAALAIGVAGILPAAATGLADWRHLRGTERRAGAVHALLNTVGLVCHAGSLAARAQGMRGRGRLLLLGGYAVNGFAAHLGGQLSFGLGVRVNRTAWERPPADWTDAGPDGLGPGELRRVELGGVPVLLARAGGGLCAIAATCSHLGGPLDEGTLEGTTVVCPWHASRFDLRDGSVVGGPAVFPQPCYETRVRDARIELRPARAPGSTR